MEPFPATPPTPPPTPPPTDPTTSPSPATTQRLNDRVFESSPAPSPPDHPTPPAPAPTESLDEDARVIAHTSIDQQAVVDRMQRAIEALAALERIWPSLPSSQRPIPLSRLSASRKILAHRSQAQDHPPLSRLSASRKIWAHMSQTQGHPHTRGFFKLASIAPKEEEILTGPRPGSGFQNISNTCFLNSVLQVLIHIPTLVDALKANEEHTPNTCKHTLGSVWCAICALKSLIDDRFTAVASNQAVVPHVIINHLREFASSFQVGKQEDAHEFMSLLFSAMQNADLGLEACTFSNPSPDQIQSTLVGELFFGQLKSSICCSNCQAISSRTEGFLDLGLDLICPRVQEAILEFSKPEKLCGDSQYHCESCGGLRDAERYSSIISTAPTLVICLKRFSPLGEKIHQCMVADPLLKLPLDGPTGQVECEYELYGVVCHDGRTPWSGHYMSYVRIDGGGWFVMNDERVYRVDEPTVINSPSAYILFYKRKDS